MSEDARSRSLISSGAVMAAGTMASRVLGFVRAIMIAVVLGNGTRQGDMFTLANTIPNSLYILFAGGALNTVLVPQIVRATKNDEDHGEAYTNRIMTAFLAIIAAVTVVLLLAAPLVLRIYTDTGWRGEELDAQYESMLTLTYLCLPQVFFYGAFFLAGQVLNARGRFGPMMWAPIANNVVSIAVFALYLVVFGSSGDRGAAFTGTQELVLGLGATLGIVVQAAILLPFLRRAGFVYRPRFDLRGTGLGHTFSLAKWTLGFVAVTQLALVAVNRLASSATTGGSGAGLLVYNNAYLVWILPHSVITISLATAMVTSASRMAADGDVAGVARETTRTLRLTTTVLLPAAVAFLALALPISRLIFGFGEGAEDYPLVAWALMAFAIGLVPFTVHYVCLRAFYALEDTRTPFLLQALIAGLNAGLAVLLVRLVDDPRLVAAALGLAYSLAYTVGVVVAYQRLRRSLPTLTVRPLVRHLVRVGVAIAPAGAAAWLITWGLARQTDSRLVSAGALVLAGVVALAMYVAMARLLHLREMDDIVSTVLRRGRGTDQAGTTEREGDEVGREQRDDTPDRLGPATPETVDATPVPTGSTGPTPVPTGADVPTEAMSAVDVEGLPVRPAPGTTAGPGSDADEPTTTLPPAGPATDGWAEQGAGPVAEDEDPEDGPPETSGPRQRAGDVLGRRYRLEEVLAGRADAHTWRAFDQVLSRSVLVQVLPPEDPRSPALLEAARASAVATDSRFLRVLDAVYSDDPAVGSYIVTEFSPGQTLEVLLNQGPLSALEAAWLVREAADALAGMHAMKLHHGHLGPDALTITPAGNLKITGFLLEAAIVPTEDEAEAVSGAPREEDPEVQDVRDLGRLLYAALVSRWPGAARYGLEAAPRDGDRLLTPRQVRHGVSPALDRITDQILSPVPRQHDTPLTTAAEVAGALNAVLGTADASHDLERRVRQPVPVVGAQATTAVPAVSASSPVSAPVTEPMGTGGAQPMEPTGVRVVETGRPAPRRWLWVLLLLLVLALVFGLVGVYLRNQAQFTGNAPDPAPSVAPAPVEVREVIVFDPEGDPPGDENNDTAPQAVDGDPGTAWETVYYLGNPQLGGLKRGVGLVLDLGDVQQVGSVDVLLPDGTTSAEILVPTQRDVATAPTSSDEDWDVVAEQEDVGGQTAFQLEEPVSTRYVLVYLTSLPADGDRFRGRVLEVQVTG
ncbi:murein biosynthesis integral membrane protein MurJ [Auraticoccus monumenti]|uniref:Putative peptidoglycan lipid II flippase n=1 Tax=Auraticoccus monumenti TaxID=675864 RepID=A0A1G6U0H2_9ACTN|nr:murein biosynthesis integral membrane protein MurJ [Auraticoccus monumenti]SDD34818.1 putative peptidoglycan lipid II flippase [Auraticoccus monumenti]